jgi:hypothetical protein
MTRCISPLRAARRSAVAPVSSSAGRLQGFRWPLAPGGYSPGAAAWARTRIESGSPRVVSMAQLRSLSQRQRASLYQVQGG